MIIFWLLDFVRKAALCIVLIMSRSQLCLQLLVMYMTSFSMMVIATYTQARSTSFTRKMDIFNEVKIIFLMYHMICFTPLVPDANTQFYIGYSCCANLVLGLAVNML